MTSAVGDLGRALEETALLVRSWRDQLGDDQYVHYVEIFGAWFEHERGRLHYAVGRHEEAET